MSVTTAVLLLVIAFAIIGALVWYALKLQKQVRAREAEKEAVVHQARVKTLENIHLISRALLDEQVDVMEASLRLRALIDIIEPEWFLLDEVKVFAEISGKGSHLATHQARKELPKQERMKQDVERLSLEAEYHEAAYAGARWLLEQKA